MLRHLRQNLFDHVLRHLRPFEEEFDSGCQQLELDSVLLVREPLEKALKQFRCIVDPVCVLAYDPHHGRFCFRIVQCVQVRTERRDDVFILVGILAKDVSDDYDGLCVTSHHTQCRYTKRSHIDQSWGQHDGMEEGNETRFLER